ncbi:hypothetical protein KAT95_00175 [Candidatus Parcubacteria bacterium]|nr:hypothetical protein [Candidatus Parcubacteria bacterium]
MKTNNSVKIFFVGLAFCLSPFFVSADYIGQNIDFFIDSLYDSQERDQISATLRERSSQLYFYIDDQYWNQLNDVQKQEKRKKLDVLAEEFEEQIYPLMTPTFGIEWNTGIDNDGHITVLIHKMINDIAGYFNAGDEYEKALVPASNEREMVYLSSDFIDSANLKGFLAHEFMHLITFNQKDNSYGISEEIWLNEARADHTSTFLGYDDEYENSNLSARVRSFLNSPGDSLTEWLNEKSDYAVVNLFTQYLVDHYGIKILVDSLTSSKTGIASLNYALEKNGFDKDFSDVFTDWTITVLINDCELGEEYCYLNDNLRNLKISPRIIFLPKKGETTLSVSDTTKDWAGNWHKIIGGKDALKVEFEDNSGTNLIVPYLIESTDDEFSIGFIEFDDDNKAVLYVSDFGTKNKSLFLLPSVQEKTAGFNGEEDSYKYSFTLSTVKRTPEQEEAELRQALLAQIAELQAQIAMIQAKINAILAERNKNEYNQTCQNIENNLSFGFLDNNEVSCLQEFLKSQGQDVYPEGLVTGNFLSLTKKAVIRFQEKYKSEILEPLGLENGTGFVGSSTRAKINELLNRQGS